jgi:hypothetical protein
MMQYPGRAAQRAITTYLYYGQSGKKSQPADRISSRVIRQNGSGKIMMNFFSNDMVQMGRRRGR